LGLRRGKHINDCMESPMKETAHSRYVGGASDRLQKLHGEEGQLLEEGRLIFDARTTSRKDLAGPSLDKDGKGNVVFPRGRLSNFAEMSGSPRRRAEASHRNKILRYTENIPAFPKQNPVEPESYGHWRAVASKPKEQTGAERGEYEVKRSSRRRSPDPSMRRRGGNLEGDASC